MHERVHGQKHGAAAGAAAEAQTVDGGSSWEHQELVQMNPWILDQAVVSAGYARVRLVCAETINQPQ